jgi:hypothetical protein
MVKRRCRPSHSGDDKPDLTATLVDANAKSGQRGVPTSTRLRPSALRCSTVFGAFLFSRLIWRGLWSRPLSYLFKPLLITSTISFPPFAVLEIVSLAFSSSPVAIKNHCSLRGPRQRDVCSTIGPLGFCCIRVLWHARGEPSSYASECRF